MLGSKSKMNPGRSTLNSYLMLGLLVILVFASACTTQDLDDNGGNGFTDLDMDDSSSEKEYPEKSEDKEKEDYEWCDNSVEDGYRRIIRDEGTREYDLPQ